MERAQETFMEAKKNFVDASTLGSKDRLEREMDPSMLTMFLEMCMKLLRDSKAMKGLQELIHKCARTMPGEPRIVEKIRKHKIATRKEMILTAEIGEYEMDQVILDL